MYMPDHPPSLMGSHHRHRRSAHRARQPGTTELLRTADHAGFRCRASRLLRAAIPSALGPDPRGPRHPAPSQQPGYTGVGPTVPPSLSPMHTQKLRHGSGCIFGSHRSVTGAGWALRVCMYMPDHPLSHTGSHHRHRRSAHRAPSASSGGRSPGGRGSVRVIPYGSG